MSFFLEEEKLGSSQEPSSFWEFIATSLGRNKEGGGMYSGLGLPRSPTDCNGPQGGHKKTILHVHRDIGFASTIWNKSNKHMRGQWILSLFQGMGQWPLTTA